MSSSDWARVSSTCRTTLAVRVTNVKVPYKGLQVTGEGRASDRVSYNTGVKWACKMLPGAAVLSLPVRYGRVQCAEALADTVASRPHDLAGLQQLHLESDDDEEVEESYPCLPWLLSWAQNLSLLETDLGSTPWLPLLMHIKHLVLVLKEDIGNVCRALPKMSTLETLSISGSGCEPDIDAPLVLDMLPCLVSVALKGICPVTLSLPEDCKLSFDNLRLHEVRGTAWQDKEINLCSIGIKLQVSHMSELLVYVGTLHALVNVSIHLTAARHRDDVVRIDLCCMKHVKRVQVSGSKLHITVPAESSWDFLKFDASDTLRLDVEAKRLVELVPNFSARFQAAVGIWVAELAANLAVRQIGWGIKRVKRGSPEEALEKYRLWYALGHCRKWCCCGACMGCLVAEGKAIRPK